MSAISVETSQNVKLEYQIASVGERILANLLDRLLFLGWFILIAILTEQLELQFNTVTVIVILVPVLLYHLACEVFFNGQSVGKHTLRIKVLKVNGMQPSLGDYLMRWIFRIVDCGIGGGSIALLCILINGRGQRLGDIAAGTAVVRTLRPTRLDDIAAPETSPGYTVRYPEAMTLSDKDISVIRKILKKSLRTGDRAILAPLAEKVGEITGIPVPDNAYLFLTTIVNDYNYLAGRSSTVNL